MQRLPSACSVRQSSACASSIWVNCASVGLAPVAVCAGTGAATAFSLSLSLPSVLGTGQVFSTVGPDWCLFRTCVPQYVHGRTVCSGRQAASDWFTQAAALCAPPGLGPDTQPPRSCSALGGLASISGEHTQPSLVHCVCGGSGQLTTPSLGRSSAVSSARLESCTGTECVRALSLGVGPRLAAAYPLHLHSA